MTKKTTHSTIDKAKTYVHDLGDGVKMVYESERAVMNMITG